MMIINHRDDSCFNFQKVISCLASMGLSPRCPPPAGHRESKEQVTLNIDCFSNAHYRHSPKKVGRHVYNQQSYKHMHIVNVQFIRFER